MGSHAQGGGVGGGGRTMADAVRGNADRSYAWGPLSALGLAVAAITCLIDQAAKFWLLFVVDLPSHARLSVTPFLALVLTWNTGISYGLFPQRGPIGAWALLAFKAAAVVFLWVWLARASSRLTALALGLIIGGALGNALDRLHWPGVMDFVLLHVETAGWSFRWYVFNLADAAIVAGVVGLLYESLRRPRAAKAP
jgi:signal peptidase II